jgi:hypothetical protein
MVTTTEVGQLAGECNLWLDTLRTFRNTFQHNKSVLQDMAVNQTQKDILLEIEHLDNQFHIQLINIHDLKQAIKRHKQKVSFERAETGHISDDLLARHEFLYDEFQRQEATLETISKEFGRFSDYVK